MTKREYYGELQINSKKFRQKKKWSEGYDGGMEISYRVDGEMYPAPVAVCFGDNFQGYWVYEDQDGAERIFRVRLDYITREQMEKDRMGHNALHGIDIRDHRGQKNEGID